MVLKLFAAVGIGSSESEMKIFECSRRKGMREIDCLRTRLNLGADAYRHGRIDSRKIEELCSVLLDFKRIMQSYGVSDYKVCATSAFRESRNMLILCDYI